MTNQAQKHHSTPMKLTLLALTLTLSACKPTAQHVAEQVAPQGGLVVSTESSAPAIEPPPFDPAGCKGGDKKYVYWAARDQVFRFKYNPKEPLYPLPEQETMGIHLDAKREVPPAPVPSEPEGCFGNPLRASSVPYMKTFDADLFHKVFQRDINLLTEGVHGHFAGSKGMFRNSREKQVLESNDCWFRASGIQECLLANPEKKERSDYSINHAFKIHKKLLPDHSEVPNVHFIVKNDAASTQENGKEIASNFDLFGGVHLDTSLRIFPNEIDLLIPYYSGLIRYVLDAHVLNYNWSPPKTP